MLGRFKVKKAELIHLERRVCGQTGSREVFVFEFLGLDLGLS